MLQYKNYPFSTALSKKKFQFASLAGGFAAVSLRSNNKKISHHFFRECVLGIWRIAALELNCMFPAKDILIMKKLLKNWSLKSGFYLWSIELDPGLSFDQCGWQLHYNGLDSVGWGPSLGRHELHAQCSTVKDVAAVENWMDHTDKGRVEREGILEGEREQNVIFSFFLLQFLEILGKRGVWVYPHDLDVPLVERVVDQLHLVGAGFEWRTSVDIAQFFHQSVGGLYRSGHSALKRYTFKKALEKLNNKPYL